MKQGQGSTEEYSAGHGRPYPLVQGVLLWRNAGLQRRWRPPQQLQLTWVRVQAGPRGVKGSSLATAGWETHAAAAREAPRRRALLLAERARRREAERKPVSARRSRRGEAGLAAGAGARARAMRSAGGCTRHCACGEGEGDEWWWSAAMVRGSGCETCVCADFEQAHMPGSLQLPSFRARSDGAQTACTRWRRGARRHARRRHQLRWSTARG